MECRVNIWLTMPNQAEAEREADKIHEDIDEAWKNKTTFRFWGPAMDGGDVEVYNGEIAVCAMLTKDITKEDAVEMFAYFRHMHGCKGFVMEVEDVKSFHYAIYKNMGFRFVMEYIPREHFPEFKVDSDGYADIDINELCEAFDKYKVTKTIALDKGFGIYNI